MAIQDRIYSLDLKYRGVPASFVIRSMEGIDRVSIGAEAEPHRHNYYSIIWPWKGSGRHIVDFRDYPLLPGQLFFISPWQVHQVLIDEPLQGFIILFTAEFLERNSISCDFISNLRLFSNSDETPPLQVPGSTAASLGGFADRMMAVFKDEGAMYLDAAGAYLKLFLIECNGLMPVYSGSGQNGVESSKTIVRNFRDLVEKRFSDLHQVKDYAEALNVTPNYLNEVIRSTMKVPAKEFIQKRLLLEAKRMALFTDKPAKEIGFDLGFDDPSHFSKFFRSNYGKTLQEFRESIIA